MIARRERENNLYERLRLDALEKIQALSGNRWTDFNEHDPGVTILDALHYALLELDYTLQFPLESYLAKDGKIDFKQLGLFPAEELFAPSIVTPADYEKLILDNMKAIKNCRVTLLPNQKYFIEVESGELRVESDSSVESGEWRVESEKTLSTLNSQLSTLFHAHRNLGETLDRIEFRKLPERRNRKFGKDDVEYETTNVIAQHQRIAFSAEHFSIQNHFPDCYGINEKGMSAGANAGTQAKIRQLQAYLLIFDYLLATTKQQVANIPQLFELSGNNSFDKMPEIALDATETLTDKARWNENRIVDGEFWQQQKSNYLDILDTLYGEDTKRFFSKEQDLSIVNQKRAELIRRLPQLNAIRFRSFNILKKREQQNEAAGIIQFLSAVNGQPQTYETSVVNLFSRYNLRLLNDEEFFREHKNLNVEFITNFVEHQLFDYEIETVPVQAAIYDDKQFHRLRNQINLFRHHLLFETFLTEGSHTAHYKMAYWHRTNSYLLLFKIPNRREWLNLGLFADKQTLIETANLLWQFLKMLREQSQQIYLIEHILLDEEEENGNKITIVIPHWATFSFSPKELESLLRERFPAHLDVRFRWLHAEETYEFERAYFEWREALASQDKEWIKKTSGELRMES